MIRALLVLLVLLVPHALSAPPVRTIQIQFAVTPEFQAESGWKQDLEERVRFANVLFESPFQIRFEIQTFKRWAATDERRETDSALQELQDRFALGNDEIVIGVHRMTHAFKKSAVIDADTIGSALAFRGYLLLRDPHEGFSQRNET